MWLLPLRARCESCRRIKPRKLLRFFLLLLADADLEMLLLGFLKSLVVVTLYGAGQIRVDIGIPGQDGHNGEAFVASRAKRTKPLYVRDCHTHSG